MRDLQWVNDNLGWLRTDHAGCFIAVKDEMLLAIEPDLKDLLGILRDSGVDGAFITHIPEEEILWDFAFANLQWKWWERGLDFIVPDYTKE